MPKETIEGTYSFGDNPLGVEVCWGRDTSVQIATVDRNAKQYTAERGWFVSVDRGGINHLIRTLRKARDQAYGADE